MGTDDAVTEQGVDGPSNRGDVLLFVATEFAVQQVERCVIEHPVQLPFRIAPELSALDDRMMNQAEPLESFRVDDGHVAAHPLQDDGTVRDDRIDHLARRHLAEQPIVEPFRDDPIIPARLLFHRLKQRVQIGRLRRIDPIERFPVSD